MYLYETHLHTYPVSKCAVASVRESVEFYKKLGYTGIFITNHFLDGNINLDPSLSYEEKINFYFSDYEEAVRVGEELGISVFLGHELSVGGTDFLVYGLDKAWFLAHPEIMDMKKSEELTFMASHGALIIQAHPFREARYIDHIRLFPRRVHGVETFNACRTDFENARAKEYAKSYSLISFAGTDNHFGAKSGRLGGMKSKSPILDEEDFVRRVKLGEMTPFKRTLKQDS
ncbi:MAG: histidinol phosphatase [Clostridia bacterium]|nr:histidinol phosphatase [Clostridia bacterium]